jgi:hypothetical protein
MGDYKNSPDYGGHNPTLREVAVACLTKRCQALG